MSTDRDFAGSKKEQLLGKLVEMSEQQFNRLVGRLSVIFAFVGLLCGVSIIVLRFLGVLNLPTWQEIALLLFLAAVPSAFGGYLIQLVREERVRIRQEKKRVEKKNSQNIFDKPTDDYRGFDMVLQSAGQKKIQVIKEVRAATGLGLKEAKALVDDTPNLVKEALSKEEAEELRSKFEKAGAEITFK